jgi:hypothetical protein
MLGLLLDRLGWNLRPTNRENDTMDDEDTDNDAVEPDDHDIQGGCLNATVTLSDGTTKTVSDFGAFSVDLSRSGKDVGFNEVTTGLKHGDREVTAQITLEVPTKTLTCPNCNHDNEIPVWNFTRVKFSGELEPLSGDYAVGHQCEQCGFPY